VPLLGVAAKCLGGFGHQQATRPAGAHVVGGGGRLMTGLPPDVPSLLAEVRATVVLDLLFGDGQQTWAELLRAERPVVDSAVDLRPRGVYHV
jgi:hypothetical protein